VITLDPRRAPLRWQIAALIVMTQIIAQVLTIIAVNAIASGTGNGPRDIVVSLAEPMLTALRMSDTSSATAFAALLSADPRFTLLESLDEIAPVRAGVIDREMAMDIVSAAPERWRSSLMVFPRRSGGTGAMSLGEFAVAARLQSGQVLVFAPDGSELIGSVPFIVTLMGLLVLALPLAFLSVWAGTTLVAPIGRLARGAEAFAKDFHAPAIAETGPSEVRHATRAFNAMRVRIRKLVADRGQTVAAIGHDMRTPLTRLRLRLDLQDDPELSARFRHDLDVLERMIDDALEFLRSENAPMRLAPVDLAGLAKDIVAETEPQRVRVTYDGPDSLAFVCDADKVMRILRNVAENAAKFGRSEARVALAPAPDGGVVITVTDDGPGIPLDHRERVLEPFSRLEAVRAGETGQNQGFGLGLAIARDLVERHGGTLGLMDAEPQGLCVTISLPRQAGDVEARG
jgi:signal transduction histidine kinase